MTDKLTDTTPNPLELRTELEKMVQVDLLGPAGGPDEVVDERLTCTTGMWWGGGPTLSRTSWP